MFHFFKGDKFFHRLQTVTVVSLPNQYFSYLLCMWKRDGIIKLVNLKYEYEYEYEFLREWRIYAYLIRVLLVKLTE